MNARDEIIIALSEVDPKNLRCVTPLLGPRPAVTGRNIMKRSIKWTGKLIGAAVAAVIVLGLIFLPGLWQEQLPAQAASPSEEKPLRICIDLRDMKSPETQLYVAVQKSYQQLKRESGLEHLKLEFLPRSGEKRAAALEHLRAEIMAGGGPDVFIVDTNSSRWRYSDHGEDKLFHYPKSAMRNGYFLPLDAYLEHADYLKKEDLTGSVLKCGQYEGQQFLLPVSYSFFSTVFLREDVPAATEAIPWAECAKSDDSALAFSANAIIYDLGVLPLAFGECVDPESGTLSFTLEELQETIATALELFARDQKDLPTHLRTMLSVWREPSIYFDGGDGSQYYKTGLVGSTRSEQWGGNYGEHEEVLTHLPLPNRNGGVTASVNSFAAVNANTEYPNDAFTVLDFLFSESQTAEKEINQSLCAFAASSGFPLLDKAGSASCPMYDRWLNDESFEDLCRVRDRIEEACFWTPVESRLATLSADCWATYLECQESGEDWREAIRPNIEEAYQEMKLMAAES